MRIYVLLLALLLSALSASAQVKRQTETSNILTVTFCDLVHNPNIFDGEEVRFRATYLANAEVAAFVDLNCLAKDKLTWAEFEGTSIKASAPPEVYEKVLEQILCGKCGDENGWRETQMLVTGVFDANDIGHGWLGKYRYRFSVKNVEELSDTVKSEMTRFDLPK